ncbi:MAG: hypothetical protein Q7T75_02955, partial [Mesorhizobium sp.]|nr:hypothetical protein [Mesorhizobium sp.]
MSQFLTMLSLGGIDLAAVSTEHEAALLELATFKPVHLASMFAGLLTQPDLQANCIRLEALVHLSLAIGNGTRNPSSSIVASTFSELGRGMTGRFEDPAEDVFVSLIVTPQG